jgi:parallel beta-helix repeat protein
MNIGRFLTAPRVRDLQRTAVTTLLIAMATALDASAATYYVAPTGNDANTCAQAQNTTSPKRTIASGLTCLVAGDILYLRGGTYGEKIDSNAQRIPSGTSWSAPVTIASYPGESVTMRFGGGVLNLATNSIQYLIFDSITFDAAKVGSCPTNDGCGVAVVSLWGGANHVRIQNCELTNSVGQGITIFSGNGFSSDYNEILRSKIHDNGSSDFDHGMYVNVNNTLIDGNEIYNNAGYGIQKYPTGSNNVVRSNRIHDNAHLGHRGDGILFSGGSNNQAYNNIVWNNDNGIGTNYESGSKIYNNTIVGNRSYGAYVGSDSNTDIKNNILYGNGAGYFYMFTTATYSIGNSLCNTSGAGCSVVANPNFVNSSGGDYHLQTGSPAIDGGGTLTLVKTDADGSARPQGAGYDIGAYEFGGVTTSPPAPTNVRIVP